MTEKVKNLDDFEEIISETYIENLTIIDDTVNCIRLYGNDEWVDNINDTIIEKVIYLKNKYKTNWKKFDKNNYAEIHVKKSCYRLHSQGEGNIVSSGKIIRPEFYLYCTKGTANINIELDCNFLEIETHSGNVSDICLRGKTNYLLMWVNSLGKIDLSNLEAKHATLVFNGTNRIYLNVTNYLYVNIGHIGEVYYKGNPDTVIVNTEKKNQLYKIEN
jgi:hypothetical protein